IYWSFLVPLQYGASHPTNSSDKDFSSDSSTISYPDCSDFPNVLTKLDIQKAIASLVSQRKTGQQIHAFLQKEYLPKPSTPPALPPQIPASILSSHDQRLTVVEIRSRLPKDTGKDVSLRTVGRYLASLQLQQSRDGIAWERVTRDEVKALVHHARTQLLFSSAGYRRMRQIIIHEYQIHVPRWITKGWQTVYAMLVNGGYTKSVALPNHIWSADGHDKLKPYSITIYGFIDAWSRKNLG
ncbi:hypothetical protein MJO28_011693, partial [Puccinia striiformis f. sp. tritici]